MKKEFIFIAIWILLSYYPNPLMLSNSLVRFVNPIQPNSIGDFAKIMPDDPAEIERLVETYIQPEGDFKQYGVPWYIPTAEEVINQPKGNCKHQAVLLANVLEEKGINYTYKISPVHFWVDYESKHVGNFEQKWEQGDLPPAGYWIQSYKTMLWDNLPLDRTIVLLTGPTCIILLKLLKKKIKKN